MNDHARRVLPLLLLLAVSLPAASGVAEASRPDTGLPRRITYFANYAHDATLPANLALLVDACRRGDVTHVVLGLFHLDWKRRPHAPGEHGEGPTLSLNGVYLDSPRLMPLWETMRLLRSRGVKVIASFGGGGVGDFKQLLDPADTKWYPLIPPMLRAHAFDGIDLDIEEGADVVNTVNVRRLVRRLRKDLGDRRVVTAAPVASALTNGSSVSPYVHYRRLLEEGWFDWYHLQFYNDFGDLLRDGGRWSPDYAGVLRANPGIPAERFVAGVPTAPDACDENYHDVSALAPVLTRLAGDRHGFGGVFGWTFTGARSGGRRDPVGFHRVVAEAIRAGRTPPAPRPALAAPPARWTFHELGGDSCGWSESPCGIALSVEANGDVAGWQQTSKWAFRAARGGDATVLRDDCSSQVTAMDDAGAMAGWHDDHGDSRAFFAPPGCAAARDCWRDLGTLGGAQAEAWALAGAHVAGWSETAEKVPHAFVRTTEPGSMDDLGTLGGRASHASAVGTDGSVAGAAQDAGGSWRAFLRSPGAAMRSLVPDLAGEATALSPAGRYAAGWALGPAGFEAWVAAGGGVKRFGPRIGTQSAATAVNESGHVVGWYLDEDGRCRAFFHDAAGDEAPVDLGLLVEGLPQDETLLIATAIHEQGWIAGQTRSGRAFLLAPKAP